MNKSAALYKRALLSIPGGVNSPVRAFGSVGGNPIFIDSADGPLIFDVDGNAYVDYVGSWGPMILGHNNPTIRSSVIEAAHRGLSFGAPTEMEVKMAELVSELIPSMERVRMVNSGTEATMSAIRLARGYTGRNKIIKFEGCYHGHSDGLLVKAGSGAALTLGQPSSPGIPAAFTAYTLTARFNDLDSVRTLFESNKDEIACVIVEPVAGNMNCVPPIDGFHEGLRDMCSNSGTLLIFDEVMTGFRVALGGAQDYYGVRPDLTTLGKVIGGGMPVGAFGGRAEIMEYIAPTGPVYQAGTLSGNPVSMAAGYTCLSLLREEGSGKRLSDKAKQLTDAFFDLSRKHNVPMLAHQVGGMFGFLFTNQKSVHCYDDVKRCDDNKFKRFFNLMLGSGVYLAPSAFEASFISLAHNSREIELTIKAIDKSLGIIAAES